MGIPMPAYERFAPGTSWVLTVECGNYPPGTRVTVEEELQQYGAEDEMYVKCSTPDGAIIEPSLSILS